MLNTLIKTTMLLISLALLPGIAQALDEADVPKDKRTSLGQYYSSTEAAAFMKDNSKYALFLDVRDPHELQTTGMAKAVDYNVPYDFINIQKWDSRKSRFQFEMNPDFVKDTRDRFEAKGLSGFDAIIVICASGKRAAKAVDTLAKAGFRNVHTVVDGYNGWKYNDLEWSRKLDRSRMYGAIARGK